MSARSPRSRLRGVSPASSPRLPLPSLIVLSMDRRDSIDFWGPPWGLCPGRPPPISINPSSKRSRSPGGVLAGRSSSSGFERPQPMILKRSSSSGGRRFLSTAERIDAMDCTHPKVPPLCTDSRGDGAACDHGLRVGRGPHRAARAGPAAQAVREPALPLRLRGRRRRRLRGRELPPRRGARRRAPLGRREAPAQRRGAGDARRGPGRLERQRGPRRGGEALRRESRRPRW